MGAEEIDSLNAEHVTQQQDLTEVVSDVKAEDDAVEVGIDSLAIMTRSQYAQVVFEDVADSYPNDSDIVCNFVMCDEVAGGVAGGDKVGIFRVPFVDPHDVITTMDIEGEAVDTRTSVTFKAAQVPKEEDFYQFQYLRDTFTTDNKPKREVLGASIWDTFTTDKPKREVLGASIPFQLRKPKSEELCAVQQSGSEFMMVQTTTALASRQLSDKIGSAKAYGKI